MIETVEHLSGMLAFAGDGLIALSLILHFAGRCTEADLCTVGFCVVGIIGNGIDLVCDSVQGRFADVAIDAVCGGIIVCSLIFFIRFHMGGGNWKDRWKKLRKAGGAKARAVKARLEKKLRESAKPGRPGLRPVPSPA